jgi:molybdopterin/thiamine biosynthesis adenylyltransferase
MTRDDLKTVTLVGLGNIGSNLAAYIARLPQVGEMIVVDFDVYEEKNLESQAITARDVGQPKALVVAKRLAGLAPGLQVMAVPQRFETVPRGALRADVIVGAVDSKAARVRLGEIAWRLGVPWIDSGVQVPDGLARVAVYTPGAEAPCYECALSDADYEHLEQVHWCTGGAGTASTDAPAYLGGLAAGLAAAECEKLLSGRLDESLAGREVVVSAKHHTHFVTNYRRNELCRFDHRAWRIEKLEARSGLFSLEQTLGLVNGNGGVQLRVEGHRFVTKLTCAGCGRSADILRLSGRLDTRACRDCGDSMIPMGFYTYDRLESGALPASATRRSLWSLGLRAGDILSLSDSEGERHFQLGD